MTKSCEFLSYPENIWFNLVCGTSQEKKMKGCLLAQIKKLLTERKSDFLQSFTGAAFYTAQADTHMKENRMRLQTVLLYVIIFKGGSVRQVQWDACCVEVIKSIEQPTLHSPQEFFTRPEHAPGVALSTGGTICCNLLSLALAQSCSMLISWEPALLFGLN